MTKGSNTPPWLLQAATVLVGALLAFNVVYDALSKPYEGYTVTFGLLGLFGLLLGVKNGVSGDGK